MFGNSNIHRNFTSATTLRPGPLFEEKKLYALKNQLKELKSRFFRRELDDFRDNLPIWIDNFENALKLYNCKNSDNFLENLTTLLEDPISGEPLSEDAVLGNISIAACMLGSYGLSYGFGSATSTTPAGQGTGATVNTRFKI